MMLFMLCVRMFCPITVTIEKLKPFENLDKIKLFWTQKYPGKYDSLKHDAHKVNLKPSFVTHMCLSVFG